MKLRSAACSNSLRSQAGLTLVELITIIVIISSLSLFAVVKFTDSSARIRYQTAIQKVASDVRFAQQLALSEGQGTRVYFNQSLNRYYLTWDDDTSVKKLIGGDDFVVQLGVGDFAGVYISASELTNGRLDFNTAGQPANEGAAFSGALSVVTLNGAKKLQISANTGFLSIEDL